VTEDRKHLHRLLALLNYARMQMKAIAEVDDLTGEEARRIARTWLRDFEIDIRVLREGSHEQTS